MKSPLRVFFLATLLCLGSAWLLQSFGKNIGLHWLDAATPISIFYTDKLAIPRQYLETGQPEESIRALAQLLPSLAPADIPTAQEALDKLFFLRQSTLGQLAFTVLNVSAFWTSKLFVAAITLGIIFFFFLIVKLFGRRPLFVIIPFVDRADLKLGEALPTAVLDRLREIGWRMANFQSIKGVIAEQLDIPSLGVMSEGDSIDTVALLETALLFSMGVSDLPLARLLNSLKLWIEQPRYLVRGSFEKLNDRLSITLQIVERKRSRVVQAWNHEISEQGERRRADIIDAILYPLLFYFTKGIRARRWEALHALHVGLEEFQSFSENQDQPQHLQFAEHSMTRALQLDPAYGIARYDLGLLYLSAGDYESAREQLLDASRLLQDEQEGLWASYHYGVALFQTAQEWAYQRAARTFAALADDKACPVELRFVAKSSLAAAYAKLAKLIRNKQDEFAQKSLAEADWVIGNTTLPDALGNAWAAKGYAALATRQYERAVEAFQQAIGHTPTNLTALIGLGEAKFRLDKNEEALGILRQAALLSPLGGYVHYRIGNLYREMGDLTAAAQSYKNAPGLAIAHLALGKIYLDEENHAEALNEFRLATQINSRLSDAWSNVAWAILEAEDEALYIEAENAARRSLQLERQESLRWHRHTILAMILTKRSKTAPALKEAQAAISLAPEQAQAWYALGSAQYQTGKLDDARQSLQKVLQLDKKGFWRTKANSLLKSFPPDQ
jgi:tetratricopeptide (TPR) repeat protein